MTNQHTVSYCNEHGSDLGIFIHSQVLIFLTTAAQYIEEVSHTEKALHFKIQHAKSLVTQVAYPHTLFSGFPVEYNVQINVTILILKAQHEFGYS